MADSPSQAEVLLAAGRALWEVPTPQLRAVAVAWDDRCLYPRFVYDGSPSDEERELVSVFGTYLVADFTTLSVDESAEAVPYPSPLELRSGEVWVYPRYEGSKEPAASVVRCPLECAALTGRPRCRYR